MEPSVERELKLAVPPLFRLPSRALIDGADSRGDPPVRYTTEFFDTTDLALAAWGVVLRFRSGQGWQVKLPDTGDELLTRREIGFAGTRDEVPAAALELLTAYLRGRSVRLSAREHGRSGTVSALSTSVALLSSSSSMIASRSSRLIRAGVCGN